MVYSVERRRSSSGASDDASDRAQQQRQQHQQQPRTEHSSLSELCGTDAQQQYTTIINHERRGVNTNSYSNDTTPYSTAPYLTDTAPYLTNTRTYLTDTAPYSHNTTPYLSETSSPYLTEPHTTSTRGNTSTPSSAAPIIDWDDEDNTLLTTADTHRDFHHQAAAVEVLQQRSNHVPIYTVQEQQAVHAVDTAADVEEEEDEDVWAVLGLDRVLPRVIFFVSFFLMLYLTILELAGLSAARHFRRDQRGGGGSGDAAAFLDDENMDWLYWDIGQILYMWLFQMARGNGPILPNNQINF